MKSDSAVFVQLKAHWDRQSQVRLRRGVSEQTLKAFEDRYQTSLPGVVREYFKLADGFAAQGDQDDKGFRFWPLAEVQPVSTYDGGRFGVLSDVFLFADYMVFSWAYGITISDPCAPVQMIGTRDGKPQLIAASFEDFISRYIRDSSSLYGL